ncbi:hypothetical protein TCT1_02610 [Xenorhabdus sp. TCT-1]|uniref:Uncharacterized protein n=1 Tax=Xenorhabdus taiwanensis TaxID=3085177 RepID=A0ABM8JSN5_9GAMM|nr:hypothetical protein TCT1_02610 [Xenorhabdus sp. TCT-1]
MLAKGVKLAYNFAPFVFISASFLDDTWIILGELKFLVAWSLIDGVESSGEPHLEAIRPV